MSLTDRNAAWRAATVRGARARPTTQGSASGRPRRLLARPAAWRPRRYRRSPRSRGVHRPALRRLTHRAEQPEPGAARVTAPSPRFQNRGAAAGRMTLLLGRGRTKPDSGGAPRTRYANRAR